MKISRNWLQTFFDAPLPDAAILGDALTFHVFEIDGIENIGGDDVLDVKITANRGHDCLCHFGIAKELSAILNIPLKKYPHTMPIDELQKRKTTAVSVLIEDPVLCPRYIAGYIKDVKVGPSPDWLKKSLEAIGQRSINNVVDATNYVMFNIGQPLHAFDAGKLTAQAGNYAINIRRAREGEKIIALDEKEYVLSNSMLAIVDVNGAHSQGGEAIGIAGVKGGMPAGITEATTDIIIESANFNGASVRKTAQALKLRTDASTRFEQVISPELAGYGMRAVVELIQKLAGGELVGFVDEYPVPQEGRTVAVSLSRINAVLGTKFGATNVTDVFQHLGLPFSQEGEVFTVTPPFERLDLIIPEDLIEEVGRIIGYDKIPDIELPAPSRPPAVNPNFYAAEKIREELMSQGYSEIFTSVFRDTGERSVQNKIDSDKPYLRNNLQPALAEAWMSNSLWKDLLGIKTVKIFEIGPIWKDGQEVIVVGTAEGERISNMKGSETLKTSEEPLKVNVPVDSYDNLPLSSATRYQSFSKYPYIVRDIAMWTPSGTKADDVLTLIKQNAGALLARCEKFDEFTKGDKTSYAFRLIFQSFERTLTDIEVNAIMEKMTVILKEKGFEIR